MYQLLLPLHSIIRWLLVIGLLYCIVRSIIGLSSKSHYNKLDDFFRGFTSGISHIQLIIGLVLYFKSPITTYFRSNIAESSAYSDIAFFGFFHASIMIISVLLITIGSSKAKRPITDREKHNQIIMWFGTATLLLLFAIPWPFHPYAARPYLRTF